MHIFGKYLLVREKQWYSIIWLLGIICIFFLYTSYLSVEQDNSFLVNTYRRPPPPISTRNWATFRTNSSQIINLRMNDTHYHHQNRIEYESSGNGELHNTQKLVAGGDNKRTQKFKPNSKIFVNCKKVWVSAHTGGRLGNQMCEYAHLLVLHLDYGIQVGLRPYMHKALSPIFPNLSIQLLPRECLEDQESTTLPWLKIKSLIEQNQLREPKTIGLYPCNASALWHHRYIWQKEFTFAPRYSKKAAAIKQKILNNWLKEEEEKQLGQTPKYLSSESLTHSKESLKERGVSHKYTTVKFTNSSALPTVIGVHVRRGDYSLYLRRSTGAKNLDQNYFFKAFQIYRQKYGKVLFIVSSDDKNWCRKKLQNEDVIIAPGGSSPATDMALLSLSSHFIMSLGTYGFWASVLSKGNVIYPQKVGVKTQYFMSKNLNKISSPNLMPLV